MLSPSSQKIYNIQKKEKKKKRRKYEKEVKKKTKRKKERSGGENEREEYESEKKENNMGKLSLPCKYLSLPITSIPFRFPPCLYPVYHSTPPLLFSINPYLPPSSCTSFGRIIKHQWYLSLYIISNFFTC